MGTVEGERHEVQLAVFRGHLVALAGSHDMGDQADVAVVVARGGDPPGLVALTLETHPAAPDLAAGHQLQLRLARRQATQLVDQLLQFAQVEQLLDLRELEQLVDQLSRLPSRQAQLELVPGSEVGGSRVRLKGERDKPWRVSATRNNDGDVSLSALAVA